MAPQNNHAKISLSNNSAGSIRYCENCDVVELELGAISLRLDAASFEAVSELIIKADKRLSLYKYATADLSQSKLAEYGIH